MFPPGQQFAKSIILVPARKAFRLIQEITVKSPEK